MDIKFYVRCCHIQARTKSVETYILSGHISNKNFLITLLMTLLKYAKLNSKLTRKGFTIYTLTLE